MQRVAKFEKVALNNSKKTVRHILCDRWYRKDIRRYKASEKSNGRFGRLCFYAPMAFELKPGRNYKNTDRYQS